VRSERLDATSADRALTVSGLKASFGSWVASAVATTPLFVRRLDIDPTRKAEVPRQQVQRVCAATHRASADGKRDQARHEHDQTEPGEQDRDPNEIG
jgi:hypothetical protein